MNIIYHLNKVISPVLELFFPNICLGCKNLLLNKEKYLCVICYHQLPRTEIRNTKENIVHSEIKKLCQLEETYTIFYYSKKGIIQNLLKELKYRNNQNVGIYLGEIIYNEIKENSFFNDIDIIIPVPIHKKKLKKRGYNQLTLFGKTLSKKLQIEYSEDYLVKKENTISQTKKSNTERKLNIQSSFELIQKEKLKGKKILLIDDIITTGSTIKACTEQLLKIENVRISILAIAYTPKF